MWNLIAGSFTNSVLFRSFVIARLSMRKLYDERGNVYFGVDHDIRERLQAKLMMAVLTFKAEE